MDRPLRVRFAPSPTGTLHLGSARTALYNWLIARSTGGTFVLRIEDTDRERSTTAAIDEALRIMRWLGLDWDEGPGVEGPHGPYLQSERGERYTAAAESLLSAGHAYRCFCSAETIDAARERAAAAGAPQVYEGTCRDISADEAAARHAAGESSVLRFRVPTEGSTVVDDVIKGPTEFDNALIGDFVIARADGTPIYNFAVVVDDVDMEIDLVVRGDDHLSNTPRQQLMYAALGAPLPRFAHVPMIHGPDGKKLSKRHGASSVEELAADGYLPAALRNYLALLGWSLDDESTVLTTDQLIAGFDVTRVRKSPASFDYAKLRWINGQHLRLISADEFAAAWTAWRDAWLTADDPVSEAARSADAATVTMLAQQKVDTFADVAALVAFLATPFSPSDEARERLINAPEAAAVLTAAEAALTTLDVFTVENVEETLRGLCTSLDRKPRIVFGPVRFAVTGQVVSPGLFESIAAIGRTEALARISSARAHVESAAPAAH